MSFQGDVAGIGLGELLQGLTRGGRDGVLTLDGEGGLSCFLGMQGAQIFFLPGTAEDTDHWRERCQRAWADYPEPNFEGQRRSAIAHATRRETLYSMLEAPNLHFRFEPGAMPVAPSSLNREEGGGASEQPWGPGYSVEFLLLEHARIQDESGTNLAANLAPGDMPRAMDIANAPKEAQPFLEQCDGASTLEEISDRLGWPLRQTRGVLGEHMAHGHVRVSESRELLVSTQRELELGRIGRAAARLSRWIDLVPPGPVFYEGESELLLGEWAEERLILALNVMTPRRARGVLKRLDFVSPERRDALARWRTLAECNRRDSMTAFKCAVLAATDAEEVTDETEAVATELVRLARGFQDKGCPWRARAILRLAATQPLEKISARIELGTRLVQVGLIDEGAPWIVDAAREHMSAGNAEKAIPPLRILATADAENREASGLLIEARAHKSTMRRKRRNSLIALALLLVVSGIALVQVQTKREYDRRLAEITDLINQPASALRLMDEYFPADESPRVVALRAALHEQRSEKAREARSAWLADFDSIEREIESGDPLLGLQRALDLTPPPATAPGEWPTRQDLLGILANRLEASFEELDFSISAPANGGHGELELATLIADVLAFTDGQLEAEGVEDFRFFAGELDERLRTAQDERAATREALDTAQLEAQQDQMLAAARAHAADGDLKRSVAMYERLLSLPGSEELRPLLSEEFDVARAHRDAVEQALELARAGEHARARAVLEDVCPDLSEHAFPWRVESVPTGARARFRGDSIRVTPFVMYSSFGESTSIAFRMDGCEERVIDVDDPRDLLVHMYREPERSWKTGRRVDAAPVPVGDDHIVADRSGLIARLQADGSLRWSARLETLGGIARTPMFVPRRPGYLLVLSEEGRTWLVRASDGATEGPYEFDQPPVEGPVTTRSGVSARFADGRVALWSDSLEPHVFENEGLFQDSQLAANTANEGPSNLEVLSRSAASDRVLSAPWYGWTVEVEKDHYVVRDGGAFPQSFTVRRTGEWSFVAWEAPNALVRDGRLWIADAGGLRSFRPAQGPLAQPRR